jgi:hypothetical protein
VSEAKLNGAAVDHEEDSSGKAQFCVGEPRADTVLRGRRVPNMDTKPSIYVQHGN